VHQENKNRISSQVYHLGNSTAELDTLWDMLQGEVTDEAEQLERFVAQSTDETLEALGAWLAELDGQVELIKVQAERLAAAKDTAKARQAWAKDRIRDVLNARGERKRVAGTFTFSLRKGAQRAVMFGEFDPDAVAPEFVRRSESVSPDKKAILAALKNGDAVAGFELERSADSVGVK